MFKTLEPLILASGSPRRKQLLQSVGIDPRAVPAAIQEPEFRRASAAEAAERWAGLKASSVSASFVDFWVLGADTVVILDGKIFGKPVDRHDARRMLQALSDRTHDVITGICLEKTRKSFRRIGSVLTRVHFRKLSNAEIQAYINTGEPMDKAGAYGIQGIGAALVRSIEGSYTNVVGLPLCETVEWLLEQGVIKPD